MFGFLTGTLVSLGVLPAGVALLDVQGYAAVLTVEASDEPHGVLNFALSSRFILLQEANTTIQLFINREFGSLGLLERVVNRVPREGPLKIYFSNSAFKSIRKNDVQDSTL